MEGKKVRGRKRYKNKIVVKKEKQTKSTKKDYINKYDMYREVVKSHEQNKMTDELAKMLLLLAERISRKPRFIRYTYREDMVAYSLCSLMRSWRSFDPNKSKEPFSYYTQCIHNSFWQFINGELKQTDIKDELLLDNGMNPSDGYMIDYELERANEYFYSDDDESSHYEHVVDDNVKKSIVETSDNYFDKIDVDEPKTENGSDEQ